MNTKLKMNFNNTYCLELIDSSTGTVKQSGKFHNLTTKYLRAPIVGQGYGGTSEGKSIAGYTIIGGLSVGSGTTSPTAEDTALAKELWHNNLLASTSNVTRRFEWLDEYTGKATVTVTFPATSAYVGTVTEVGIYSSVDAYSYNSKVTLCTRALLTDSEGQLISFTKTDTDILKITVTVELSLASLSNSFTIFKYPILIAKLLHNMGASGLSNYKYNMGTMQLCRYHFELENFMPYSNNNYSVNIDQGVDTDIVGLCTDSVCYFRYPVTRLGTDVITNERYYKGIAIPGIGYWKLPNEDVLPAYTITGIEVGTGDGITTDFKNPLCYFKAGTDKVYKNGAQLTRDVDYTINNIGNKDCLPEVAEFIAPSVVKSDAVSNTTLAFQPLFLPAVTPLNSLANPSYTRWFSGNSPLYIEYAEEVTFNCLKCTGGFRYIQGTNGYGYIPTGTKFYLDYSVDGINYTELGSYTTTSSDYFTSTAFTIDFDDTTAKYWRLRTSYTSYPIGIGGVDYYIMLNRKDPYIKFSEAPADGDIITMDVEMDIIMKNSKFVLDVGGRVDFTV